METIKTQKNPLTDTTRFVNIFNEKHDIYVNGKLARSVEPGEEQVMPLFVAELGAKHLADKVLFKKGIRAVNTPSPERDKILSEILPDITEENKLKVLTDEEYRQQTDKMLQKQEEAIASLGGKVMDKDGRIEKLEKQLKELKIKEMKKVAKKS